VIGAAKKVEELEKQVKELQEKEVIMKEKLQFFKKDREHLMMRNKELENEVIMLHN